MYYTFSQLKSMSRMSDYYEFSNGNKPRLTFGQKLGLGLGLGASLLGIGGVGLKHVGDYNQVINDQYRSGKQAIIQQASPEMLKHFKMQPEDVLTIAGDYTLEDAKKDVEANRTSTKTKKNGKKVTKKEFVTNLEVPLEGFNGPSISQKKAKVAEMTKGYNDLTAQKPTQNPQQGQVVGNQGTTAAPVTTNPTVKSIPLQDNPAVGKYHGNPMDDPTLRNMLDKNGNGLLDYDEPTPAKGDAKPKKEKSNEPTALQEWWQSVKGESAAKWRNKAAKNRVDTQELIGETIYKDSVSAAKEYENEMNRNALNKYTNQ